MRNYLLVLLLLTVACSKKQDDAAVWLTGHWSNQEYASNLYFTPLANNQQAGRLEETEGIGSDCFYSYVATSNDPEMHDFISGVLDIGVGDERGVQAESCNLTGTWNYAILADGELEICTSNNVCHRFKGE